MIMQAGALRRSTDHAEAIVRSLYRGLIEAWNQHNAEGVAALFSEDGSVVGPDGTQMDGAHVIVRTLRRIFAEQPPHPHAGKIREVRFLTPSVAIVRADAGSHADPELHTLIAEKLIGEWMIALFQTTPAPALGTRACP